MNTPFVAVRSVTKTYRRGQRRVTALREVSFALSQGELALLVGPSGSGKTTLLNLVAALDRPDRGEIIVGGADVTGLSRSAAALYRNERVGFIFQSYNLLPQLTALENILVPMLPKRRSDPGRGLKLLDAVGLGDRARHRPSELSGASSSASRLPGLSSTIPRSSSPTSRSAISTMRTQVKSPLFSRAHVVNEVGL